MTVNAGGQDDHARDCPPDCWTNGRAQQLGFLITSKELYELIESRELSKYEAVGGTDGVAEKILSNLSMGLSDIQSLESEGATTAQISETLAIRKLLYGTNIIDSVPKKSFFRFVLETLNDKMLVALCIAAVIQVGIGIYNLVDRNDYSGMSDGISILLVVILVVLITSINDYRKQGKFRQLNSHSVSLNTSSVIRDNNTISIPSSNLLTGDVLHISSGMIVPVDGLLIEGIQLKMNESSVTGESKEVVKTLEKDPFILSGTSVLEGHGKMLVTAVGSNTIHGRVLLSLTSVPRKTPLQVKLSSVAEIVAKIGLAATTIFLTLLLIAYFSSRQTPNTSKQIFKDIVEILLVCIAVIVIAIPEGLPLSVTLALAYAAMNMINDKCLVRNLISCETMGSSTSVCTDKTGTLTMNTMNVTSCFLCNSHLKNNELLQPIVTPDTLLIGKSIVAMICCAINMNTTARKLTQINEDQSSTFTGSRTEIALIKFTELMGYPSDDDRKKCQLIALKPFSSAIKYSAVVFRSSDEAIFSIINSISWPNNSFNDYPPSLVCVTGASEVVLYGCTHFIDLSGKIQEITDHHRSEFLSIVEGYASQALRTLAVSIKTVEGHFTSENFTSYNYINNNILCALMGISDPLRPEVPKAIRDCQKAGITVRMVTGDNVVTAKAISKNCGIINNDDDIVIEGSTFRSMGAMELHKIIPKLRVLARSSPMDKQKLVKLLQECGEVVAVTGDGSNDAPALKRSDIGFSMGTDSTDIAKQASDIVVLDGNFASVSKAILWGRSISNSVKNFLQFQLCVNVSAVIITMTTSLISAFYASSIESVFKVVQLLWINLIMDTLAALSLSTDKPTEALYDRKPARLTESILTTDMVSMIFIQALYQIIVCLSIYVVALNIKNSDFSLFNLDGTMNKRISTFIFNTFVFCQVFNEINCRSCTSYKNVFNKIFKNRFFVPLQVLIVILQILIVSFGGHVFGVSSSGLSLKDWLISIALGAVALPLGYVIRCINIKTIINSVFRRRRVSVEPQSTISFSEEDDGKHLLLKVEDHPSPLATKVATLSTVATSDILVDDTEKIIPPTDTGTPDSPDQELPESQHLPQAATPGDTVGPGWQAARRLLPTIKILKALGGGRLRNEEDLEKELTGCLMLNGSKDSDTPSF